MAASVHYLGIRHHGPGSARRLCEALRALAPARVLIEGPADLDALLARIADPAMRPPVALLAHPVDAPQEARFYPFAEFSPEFQAARWALAAGVPVQFIDLPVALQAAARADTDGDASAPPTDVTPVDPESAAPPPDAPGTLPDDDLEAPVAGLREDPFAAIAAVAGYEDGESWWNDWIEGVDASGDPLQAFAAVAALMEALRERHPETRRYDLRREAHMRLAIAAAARDTEGAIAVVCGAWHVPALAARHKAGADRALLSGLAKQKILSTWVPWTSPRLASASGYGAGVTAPRWYAHLWRHGDAPGGDARWIVAVARTLRTAGVPVSTASAIEAVRLATATAALRGRPRIGIEEIRDAVVACLCGGEPLVWAQHADELLLGGEVGEIPADTPLMPLLEDLQRQQKATRLKPEALPRELALDLRSDSGAARSVLLHRLVLLDVPWGVLAEAGRSRGTFRERWTLAWQPEFAVRLVEQLVHGSTIEHAAQARSIERMQQAPGLGALTALIHDCLEAQLTVAVDAGLVLLDEQAGHAQECVELLGALPPLIDLHRYGTARALALDRIGALVGRLLVQASLALPYAARNLDAEQALALCQAIQQTHQALERSSVDADGRAGWLRALVEVADHPGSDRRVGGLCCRLAHASGEIGDDALAALMARTLSPGVPTPDAARFFEGFFDQAASRLLHDDILLHLVDRWLAELDTATFQEQLPLFRRVFSALDRSERRRLLDRTVNPVAAPAAGPRHFAAHRVDAWRAQEAHLLALLRGGPHP